MSKIEVYKCDCCHEQFDWDMDADAVDPPNFSVQTDVKGSPDYDFEHVCPLCLKSLTGGMDKIVRSCRDRGEAAPEVYPASKKAAPAPKQVLV